MTETKSNRDCILKFQQCDFDESTGAFFTNFVDGFKEFWDFGWHEGGLYDVPAGNTHCLEPESHVVWSRSNTLFGAGATLLIPKEKELF